MRRVHPGMDRLAHARREHRRVVVIEGDLRRGAGPGLCLALRHRGKSQFAGRFRRRLGVDLRVGPSPVQPRQFGDAANLGVHFSAGLHLHFKFGGRHGDFSISEMCAGIGGNGNDGHFNRRPLGCSANPLGAVFGLAGLFDGVANRQPAQSAVGNVGHHGLRRGGAAETDHHKQAFGRHARRLDHAQLIAGCVAAVPVQHRGTDKPRQIDAAQVQHFAITGARNRCPR